MNRLEGKLALITGAARGIGAAIGRAFVTEGARVCLTDIDDAAGAAFAASLGAAAYRRLDVRDEDAWRRVTDALCAEHGGIDVVVNNAGITGFEAGRGPHDPEHASLEDWHAVHRTNLDGVFLGCKHAIRAMRARGTGSIINISSRSGIVGIPAAAAYASSKAAVRNHTKSVALHCAGQGLAIRCNSIHPAAILTPMWDALLGEGPEREARMRQLVGDTPLRRFGTAEEVAAVAVMLPRTKRST
jgi:NAD(P)-dependent dehydrogenase (short-subunit alcohol dehydrogenase family)